jgi:uncharacterized membrane protein
MVEMAWSDYIPQGVSALLLLIFVITVIGLGLSYIPRDSRAQTASQVQVLGVVSFFAIGIFAYFSNSYMQANPANIPPFLTLLAHTCLFFSLMAISVSTLGKIN